MTDGPSASAGWYPDAQGEMRYWDGQAWTGHTASNYVPAQNPVVQEAPAATPAGIGEVVTKPWRKRWPVWLAIAVLVFLGIGAIGNATTPESESNVEPKPTDTVEPAQASPLPTTEPTPAPVVLLFMTDQKDGDSWIGSDGSEYRLGLVNTPERNETCGPEAAAFTRDFLASGFKADAYTTDTHDRVVAEVFDDEGESLNVALAQSGLGNDRYLEEFRHENPDLAARLDAAFLKAAEPACKKKVAPVPLVSKPAKTKAPKKDCMAGYSPCLPIVADLNCPDIGHPVTVTGSDPYRLDRDKDGVGCD